MIRNFKVKVLSEPDYQDKLNFLTKYYEELKEHDEKYEALFSGHKGEESRLEITDDTESEGEENQSEA